MVISTTGMSKPLRYAVTASVCVAIVSGAVPRAQLAIDSCVIIASEAGGAFRSDEEACAVRLSPASTFKIPHALVALQTGVVTPETREQWDGTDYPGRLSWQRDHTVLSALKPSVLWFFQRIAPRIGADRMRMWLTRLQYGNANVSGDITQYWFDGTLRISADEQVAFLRRFYARELQFDPSDQFLVENALEQQPGVVETARGVHPLGTPWPRAARLTCKTGATTLRSGESVSWLVGKLTVAATPYVFASVAWRERGTVDQLEATRLAMRTFAARGLFGRKFHVAE